MNFHEAYKNTRGRKDLQQKIYLKKYPPRFNCEVLDLTKRLDFFTRPRTLNYKLKGGKLVTLDQIKDIHGQIIIPSLTG